MFATMVVTAIEASIISLEAGTATMMQMETVLRGSGMHGEANLMQEKFAALQEAFSDALEGDPSENRPRPPFHHSG
jgi:hypothetical protein